ncbi:MAG: hypothetical protein KA186_08270 [Flavobacteriales bacterium]|nr:hypothetical protein [Flavobacteriales bacterium]
MSTLRNFVGQTAIFGASIILVLCGCSIEIEKKIVGKWVIMPNGEDSLFIDEDKIIWVSEDTNTPDTSSYQIKGDSIWIERSKHIRGVGVDSFQIVFDGPDKFDFNVNAWDKKTFDTWYERVGP